MTGWLLVAVAIVGVDGTPIHRLLASISGGHAAPACPAVSHSSPAETNHIVDGPLPDEVHAVTRILRRNRGALAACDRIAERGGVNLKGIRTTFSIQAAAERARVVITGAQLPEGLRRCYRSVARRWTIPDLGAGRTLSFSRVH